MLIRFLAKRVAILAAILGLCAFCLDAYQVSIPAGLVIGGILGVYRTRLFGRFLDVVLHSPQKAGKWSTLFYTLSQASILVLLVVAILADIRLFIGMSGGLLLVPAVICINGITEKLGLTRNEWGGCI